MPKLNLKTAMRIKGPGWDARQLKGPGYSWTAAPLYITDTFNDPEVTISSYRGESRRAWTRVIGSSSSAGILIRNGVACAVGFDKETRVYHRIHTLPPNQWAEAIIRRGTATGAAAASTIGLVVRQNASSIIFGRYDTGADQFQLYRNTTLLNSVQPAADILPVGGTGLLRIEAEGTAIRLYFNGVQVLSSTNTQLPSGNTGLRAFNSTGSTTFGVGTDILSYNSGAL